LSAQDLQFEQLVWGTRAIRGENIEILLAMALASGVDGLDHVRTILKGAPAHLNEGGLLVVEVGFNREGVEAAFPDVPFTWAEVSAGDEVVFLLTREELVRMQDGTGASRR